jgi:16S rRNA (cytosine1402-N4)-methyltransferase
VSSESRLPQPVHRPVLLDEVVNWLSPREGSVVVDGTAGAGGHTKALALQVGTTGRIVGLDRDLEMIALAERATHGLPVTLVHAPYSEVRRVLADLKLPPIDGIVLDLGLSSDQLGWAQRGFSFSNEGPLDMRFDTSAEDTAADIVNGWDEAELARIFFEYGEERFSRKIARRIVEERAREAITTTGRLSQIVRRCIPGKWGLIDPATRVFQALRIAVNDELAHLDKTLAFLPEILRPGGRAAIISFHSLEDRRVKQAFRDDVELNVLTRKPVTASQEEVSQNPRARSAKLRVAERNPYLVGPPSPAKLRAMRAFEP